MATPEGKVKNHVKQVLTDLGIHPASKAGVFPSDAAGWFFMPVSNGMGVSGIPDFLGHYYGRFFAIETKAEGKKPTKFQRRQMDAIDCRGDRAFVVDSLESAEKLRVDLVNLVFLP